MNRTRYIVAAAGAIALFAGGLVLFFIFSAEYGDGLEKTLEKAGVEEAPPVYKAPLGYGENYPTAFVAGIVGFVIVFFVAYVFGRLLGRENAC